MTAKDKRYLFRMGISLLVILFGPFVTIPFLGWGGPWYIGLAAVGTLAAIGVSVYLIYLWSGWVMDE